MRLKFWEKDTARSGPVLTETRKRNLMLLFTAVAAVAAVVAVIVAVQ